MFLNDQETATDLLYYESISQTVVNLIRTSRTTPVTIGVHGDWGAGKSSVLRMTEKILSENDSVLCLWFNGWTFEGFEDAKTVVIETIVEELKRARPTSTKVKDAAGKVLKRVDWLKVAQKAGGFALTAFTGIPTFDQVQGLFDSATALLSNPQDHISRDDLSAFAKLAGGFLKPPSDATDRLPEHIHAFREEFAALLDAADIEQLVVIVDDLDRCLPKTAIATLEAIRLFLMVERTAFVIGADEAMIEYAVKEHFPDLPPSSGPVSYARNYLEKLIQVPFRIPSLGHAETSVYVTLLLIERILSADDEKFKALLSSARDQMQRPWISKGLDRATVESHLGSSLPPEINQALALSAHVTKILGEGARGNPRQIKRFLNSLLLRKSIADARGFGGDISMPMLAKIMLAESFYPTFYEQIARLAANDLNGSPGVLSAFEEQIRSPADASGKSTGTKKSKTTEPVDLPAEAQDWIKNEWVRNWFANDPPLKSIDLRPYVFVTRDKRSSLGRVIALSHVEGIVQKLLGPKLLARSVSEEVARLSDPEASEAFESVRAHIFLADDFAKIPPGLDGMIVLVEKHQLLQRRLLDFIRELPADTVGIWPTSSFVSCISDAGFKAEFKEILTGWSMQTTNMALQKAASASLKLLKG